VRKVYLGFLYLIFPFIWLRLAWRARKAPAYAKHWKERLGKVPFKLTHQSIWIHGASLGETIAAMPILQFLKTHYPDTPIIFTTMTPTGRAKAKSLQNENVNVCYVPYDYPFAVNRFLTHVKPKLAIFIETELWPNILAACWQRQIPFFLANARMSEKSKQGYLRIAGLMKEMLQHVTFIAAQTREDALHFIQLGADKNKLQVTGSLKFDLSLPADLFLRAKSLRHYYGDRPVFIAASTHEGEDSLMLKSFVELRKTFPRLLLLLVPRHPERFNAVVQLCQQQGFNVVRRSQGLPSHATDIFVGDTLGELLLLYATADMAFVGGSLMPQGGHNPLEPAAMGLPVIMGPHVFNFSAVVRLLREAGGLIQVSPAQLSQVISPYLQDEAARQAMGARAKQVVENNRGALHQQCALIQSLLTRL